MAKINKDKINIWFYLFWSIVLFIIIFLFSIYYFIFLNQTSVSPARNAVNSSNATFNITFTKKQINSISKKYFEDRKIKNLTVDVENDGIYLYGNQKVFGSNINFGLLTKAQVIKNGNLLLKPRKLVAGSLPLPIPIVLSYVKATENIPAFIKIDPKRNEIFVDMNELPTGRIFAFKAEEINLKQDRIIFRGGLK